MWAFVVSLVTWILSNFVAKLLLGAGLTFLTASLVSGYISDMLTTAAGYLGQVPADIVQFLAYAGVGDYLSLIGGALLTRASLEVASRVIGVGKVVSS